MAIAISARTAKYIAFLDAEQKSNLMFLISRYFSELVSDEEFSKMVLEGDKAVLICFMMIREDTREAFEAEKEQ